MHLKTGRIRKTGSGVVMPVTVCLENWSAIVWSGVMVIDGSGLSKDMLVEK